MAKTNATIQKEKEKERLAAERFGRQAIPLHYILDNKMIFETKKIFDECEKDGIDFVDTVCINRLKILYGTIREQLFDKGIDSDYLAYTVAFVYLQSRHVLFDK